MNNNFKKISVFYLSVAVFSIALIGYTLPEKGFGESTADKDIVKTVTQADFKTEVLQSKTPVLVDFYATWCIPCRVYSKVLDQVAQEYEGKLKVIRVDVDKNPKLASAYNVEQLPTTQLIKNGKKFKRMIGAVEKTDLEATIVNVLKTVK
jgi:thioredoxin 1